VVRTTAPSANVVVPVSSSIQRRRRSQPRDVQPLKWMAPKTVETVTGVTVKRACDGSQSYRIVVAPDRSTDPSYDGLTRRRPA